MKLPIDSGVGIVHGDQVAGCGCYVTELKEAMRKEKGKSVEGPLCIKALDV